MASSRVSLPAALEGCIVGYESLYALAGMLQCDISPNNLMVNEDDDNPSWHAFLIDLDLAIKEDREKPSGARGKTGTRAFMAIGILYDDEQHSFMHDVESSPGCYFGYAFTITGRREEWSNSSTNGTMRTRRS
jgi:serine/threonine protein kinase